MRFGVLGLGEAVGGQEDRQGLKLGKRRAVGSVRFRIDAAGQRTVTVRLARKVRRAMRTAGVRRVRPRLTVAVTDAERQTRRSSKRVRIRR